MPGTCSSKRTDPHALQAGYCDDIPRQETGTCPRQEVFENTNREFIWALRHARIFYHIFRESLPYPCFRILLACNEYYSKP